MGGEKLLLYSLGRCPAGSPPRGRGKDADPVIERAVQGITPAWAGKSISGDFNSVSHKDHPRVGGEKSDHLVVFKLTEGSPPRGRGKAVGYDLLQRPTGITPAWAGKSAGFQSAHSGPRDHPRVGGEKVAGQTMRQSMPGSPPRGRGKDHGAKPLTDEEGITPAWAGKSTSPELHAAAGWDHPRVGGEKTN